MYVPLAFYIAALNIHDIPDVLVFFNVIFSGKTNMLIIIRRIIMAIPRKVAFIKTFYI